MNKYRVAPHIFSVNNKPCYKIQEKYLLFSWDDYIDRTGQMPIWWDYEEVKKACDHLNGKGDILEKKPRKRKQSLKVVK